MKKIKSIINLPLILVILLILLTVTIQFLKNNIIIYFIYVSNLILFLFYFILTKNYKYICILIFILLIFTLFFIRITKKITCYKTVIKTFNNTTGLIGSVDSFPIINDNKLTFTLKIKALKLNDNSIYNKTKPFRVFIKIKNSNELDINRGDILKIDKKISLPREKVFDFKYRSFLYHKNIYGIIYIKNQNYVYKINLKEKYSIEELLKNTIWKKRDLFIKNLKTGLSKRSYTFLLSIFFGMRNELDEETYKNFCNTGLIHLLAISGLHIGFIGILFYKIFKLILSKSKSLFLSTCFLLIYILIIIPSASSLRAFIMYTICSLYFILGIKTKSLSILAYTAIILIFMNPFIIYDLGFQFSFLATLGIILFSNIIKDKLPVIIHEKIKSLISVTLSAFLSIFLLQWVKFNMIPIFSVISSVFMVPLFGLLFSIFFILLIIYFILNLHFILSIIDFLIYIFLKIVNILNYVPYIQTPEIPDFTAYLSIPLLIVFFYIIDPYLDKIINKIKLNKVKRIIN